MHSAIDTSHDAGADTARLEAPTLLAKELEAEVTLSHKAKSNTENNCGTTQNLTLTLNLALNLTLNLIRGS